ncbi:hypothetical protein M426DRAFT_322512 [Hypoxylon sp. CI-4A]|nr:hypothetical protein M426DRAFT_322512 [Hypoxylon sp. CI-4A]
MSNKTDQDAFVPFTTAERIQQLGEIDRNTASLLRSVSQAMQTLQKTKLENGNTTSADDMEQKNQDFQDTMNEFLRTLRSINVGMRRQILGLEEAHIITLDSKSSQNARDEGGEAQGASARNTSLRPDGDGKIGGIDVGWLNSRSDKVERDMEADLWTEAETYFRRLLEEGGSNGSVKKEEPMD